jgi:hypothetical protein
MLLQLETEQLTVQHGDNRIHFSVFHLKPLSSIQQSHEKWLC